MEGEGRDTYSEWERNRAGGFQTFKRATKFQRQYM